MCIKFMLFLIVTTVTFICYGCSGGAGSSSGSTVNASQNSRIVSGVASKGIIVNGKIKIYSLDNNGNKVNLLATVSTDLNGRYQATIGSYTGPVLVEASGDYTDEATNQPMTIAENSPLRAAFANVSSSTSIAVSPFTEMAVRNASATSLTPINISKANELIASVFTFDPIASNPLALSVATLQTGTKSQKDHSIALAALSQMAKNTGSSINSLIDILSNEIIHNNTLTTSASTFITALHNYLDNNKPVKLVVQDSQLVLSGFSSSNLPVNSIAIGPDGTLYAGINSFAKYSSAKIKTFNAYSSSVYKLAPGSSRWVLAGKINAVSSGWSKLIIDPSSTLSNTTIYAGFDRALYKSIDLGTSWTSLGILGFLEDIAIDSSSIVYLATLSSVVKSSLTNGAISWNTVSGELPLNATIYTIAIDPNDSRILYAGGHNGTLGTGIYKSTNGGSSWSFISSQLNFIENGNTYLRDISSITVDPYDSDTIFAGAFNYGLFKSSNGGVSWTQLTDPSGYVSRLVMDKSNRGLLYLLSLNGLYYSTDSGSTWKSTLTTAGLTRNIGDIAIDPTHPNNLFVFYSGGIMQGTFDPIIKSISWVNISQ